jgi:four helix bundle protein
MTTITSFRELLVWQKAMDLTVRSFKLARTLPRDEQPALGAEMRRSALSIPSNVAEGFSRHSLGSYINHLHVAHASDAELETQLEVTGRLKVADLEMCQILIGDCQEVARMINGLIRSLERSR